ncbi:MAG: restriction endonuclease [Canidatus Methanoxibalbensis ujae]|nr:restriction endonuclease [Candidatus Methanoxibalbensis ujae]
MDKDRVIILCTAWSPDYWETSKEAPYPKRRYTDLPEWKTLASNCPLAGLGVYIKQRIKGRDIDHRDKKFVYLKIKKMKYDRNTGQPYFNFDPIKASETSSKRLLEQLPSLLLFSTIKSEDLLKILKILGEEPPQEWMELITAEKPAKSWRDYVGVRFLELIDRDLGNEEFEDRVAELFKALGFKVTQFGHKVVGEYPDGEIELDEDIILVYDCKNSHDFVPSAEDRRKLNQYIEDAKNKYKNKEIYGIFVAKSFDSIQTSHLFFPIGSLVYLLYKKIALGNAFTLAPFRKIIRKKEYLNQTLIDNEWRER